MKILFITDLYPIKKSENTTPLTLHNFVSEWIKMGHCVDVIKPNFILNSFLRHKPFYKTGFYSYDGVKIFNINYNLPFLCIDWKNFDAINIKSYDIIIAHMPSGIIFANKLAKKFNKPLICAVHISDIEVLTNPLYRFYFKTQLKNAYKNAKKIACRSHILQKKFSTIMPEAATKTFVAASGVTYNNIEDETQSRFSLQTSKFKILTCANLIKRKNIDKLIEASKGLDNFELKIIGDGREFNKLKRRAQRAASITFLGRLSHEKVIEEMKRADVFILPSVNETFGLVYLEAMASGCITVCTKNDGIDGIIIDNENGFLTEPTVEGIKETLLRIKNCKKLPEIQEKSIETAKRYSLHNCAEEYLKNIT